MKIQAIDRETKELVTIIDISESRAYTVRSNGKIKVYDTSDLLVIDDEYMPNRAEYTDELIDCIVDILKERKVNGR